MASMSASIRLVTGHSGPLRSRRRHVAPHTGPAASDRVAIQPVSRPRKVVVFTMSDCDHEVTGDENHDFAGFDDLARQDDRVVFDIS
jgi:hypothetical protein